MSSRASAFTSLGKLARGGTEVDDATKEVELFTPKTCKLLNPEDLLVDADCDARTTLMAIAHPGVRLFADGYYIRLNGKVFPCVTRDTRDFTQPLISAGRFGSREYIYLDVDNPLLDMLFALFRAHVESEPKENLGEILLELKTFTRRIFPKWIPADPKTAAEHIGRILPITFFIEHEMGVCRHHALLNAFLLSKLKKEGGLDCKRIIHHRQYFPRARSAHSWILVEGDDGAIYSLDSAQNKALKLTGLADRCIDIAYGEEITTVLTHRH